ncbi:MAG: hypothetical protein HPY69_01235 [Armatimonadetes bacterium]|nr:hypothetical protein [Armatimonadota bacterium]
MRGIARKNLDYGWGDLWAASRPWAQLAPEAVPPWAGQLPARPWLLVNSGRAAMLLALQALALPPGSRVGVPLYCCPTVFEAITLAGCQPEFIDIDLASYGVSPTTVKTKAKDLAALIVVHMFGYPVDLRTMGEITGDRPLIEDCAHAYGSRYQGRPVGSEGTAAIYSFGPAKWPACGGGGALLGEVVPVAERLLGQRLVPQSWGRRLAQGLRRWRRSVRNRLPSEVRRRLQQEQQRGEPPTAWHVPGQHPERSVPRAMEMGERLVLERKARLFPEQLQRQQRYARLASEILADADVALPGYTEEAEPNFYVLPLRFASSEKLLQVYDALAAEGVETHRYQRGISRIAARYYGYRGDCPNSEEAEETVLWVPLHYGLRETDVERIAQTVRKALRS